MNPLETLGEEYRNARRERDRWWQMTSVLQKQIDAELKPLAQKWGAMTAFLGRAGIYCRRSVWMSMDEGQVPTKFKVQGEAEGQAYCSLDACLKCGLEIKLRLRARPEDMAEAARQLKLVVGVLKPAASSKLKAQSSNLDGGSTESRPTL